MSSPSPSSSPSPPPPPPSAPTPTAPSSTSPPSSPPPPAATPSTSPPSSPPPPSTPSPSPPSSPPPPPADPSSPPASSPPPPSPSQGSSSPPPPPPSSKSSPNPPPPTNTSSSSSGSSSSVSTGVIIGAAAGGVVVVVLLLLFLYLCLRRSKRRPDAYQGGYHGGDPFPTPTPKDDYYYGGQPQTWQHQQHNNQFPVPEHVIKVPPPPPPAFASSGGYGSSYSSDATLPEPSAGMALGLAQSTFTYEDLVRATDEFSDANLLGQGGFGYVHRGVLPNGKDVAVKQLKSGSGQGDREFQAEVEIITRVHHRHLVSLVGYCIPGEKRLLVYEFVPNNTLEFHLHGKGRPTMDWSTRLKIALGSAKGLAYLHEDCSPKIIHRDIKAANILLDYKFEAKVADFGLAKFNVDDNTHVSTRVMGTFGYLAPEYAASGKLSEKSDVFSFGVMLLELVTGRRPIDSTNPLIADNLVDWARPLLTNALENEELDALVDPNLGMNYDTKEMTRMVACAAACIRHSARKRPRMSQVVHALEGNCSLEELNNGDTPGHSSAYGSYGGGSDYDTRQYREDMKRFRKLALASGGDDYTSSGGYGTDPSSAAASQAFTSELDTGEVVMKPKAS